MVTALQTRAFNRTRFWGIVTAGVFLFGVVAAGVWAENETAPTSSPADNPNAATQPADLQSYQNKPGSWTVAVTKAGARMKQVAMVLVYYENEHHRQMPADLGALVAEFTRGAVMDCFQTPGDERRTALPTVMTADWLNAHTSYVYLAANVKLDELDPSINPGGTTVIAFHTKIDEPFDDPKLGKVIIASCLDGHVEVLPVEKAISEIERSRECLEEARRPGAGGAASRP